MSVRRTTATLALGIAAAWLPAIAQQPAATVDAGAATAPGKAVAAQTVKTSAKIVSLDPSTRSITLKRQDGKVTTLVASEDMRNFDQLKVGDTVKAEYVQALALDLKKGGGGKAAVGGSESMTRSEAGAKPGGKAVRQVTVLADVVSVDAKKKTVTLKGPEGNLVDMTVDDPEQLKHIKKGDQVQALYSESLAISVEPAAK
jgi:Cu/Ag efflux protein CusF